MSHFQPWRESSDRNLRRLGERCPAFSFDSIHIEVVPWYESPAEQRRNARRARERERRLAWVRAQMTLYLTPIERQAVELYYLHGMPYRDAGNVMGCHASTVMRAANRAIAKLQERARDTDGL